MRSDTGHYPHYGDNNLTPTIIRKRLLRRRLLAGPASIRSKTAENGCYLRQSSLTFYTLMLSTTLDPDNRLVADVLEAEWNDKLRAYQGSQEEYERQHRIDQKLISDETREKILTLVKDFPRIWGDPSLEPRERKRMLRLLIEDVTLIKAEEIVLHVRLRGGETRTLKLPRSVPITELCKTKPETIAEIDRLLNEHTDDEVAEILTRQGHRTWRGEEYTREKIGWIRYAYHLSSRYDRLRARGCLTAKELSAELGVSTTTINQWGRDGLLRRHRYDPGTGCLYEPLRESSIVKGHGGRGGHGPSFTVRPGGRSAV